MALLLDSENADRDLTALVTVLTDTPDASSPMLCQGYIALGDGVKNLDGSGGTFEQVITIGGQTIQPSPRNITFSTAVRSAFWTTVFSVPAGAEVVIRVKSPNGADTDVDVTAYLYDVAEFKEIKGSTWSSGTDTLEAIRDAIAAAAPVEYAPDGSSTINTGNQDANTYADCALDNGTRWTIGDEDGDGGAGGASDSDYTIDVICEFNMGSNRLATGLAINGYFNRSGGGGYIVDIYVYNYTTSSWDQLSAGTKNTEMRDRGNDKDYGFALAVAHTDVATTPGEVKINFRSTRGTTAAGDVLYLDHVVISGVAAGATSPEVIAKAVHSELEVHLQHMPLFTGEVRYVDTGAGDDANDGESPSATFATIAACIAASAAGDYIKVKAGTYAEAIDLNLEGLELHGEIGVEINGSGGVPLTISADHCSVSLIDLVPAAGQIGCIITGDEAALEHVKSQTTGLTGFQIASGSVRNLLDDCLADQFSGVGFDVKGPSSIFNRCVARGSGGTEKGFNLSDTLAHRNVFNNCSTVDCATAGWDVDAGADDNLFNSCTDSDGCGTKVDDGANNTWRDFKEADLPAVDATSISGSSAAADNVEANIGNLDAAISGLSDPSAADVADAVWDEVLTGDTHNVPSSAGRRLRQLEDATILAEGTAQDGAAGTITLEAGENSNDDFYDHALIVITSGTGAGQARSIQEYDGGTLIATTVPDWLTNPVAGSKYTIYAFGEVHGYEIHAGGITAASIAANAIGTSELDISGILASVVESQGSITIGQAFQILIAALAGVTTSTGKVLKTPDGVATRMTMTIDTTNNERDTVTLNFT